MSKYLDKFAVNAATWTPEHAAERRLARLEEIARRRTGDVLRAREEVALAVGLSPSQLERARRGRLKGIRARLANQIRDVFLAAMRNEIRGIEHEIERALADGAELDSHALGALAAATPAGESTGAT